MIVTPKTSEQHEKMLQLLSEGAGIMPSLELTMIGWVRDDKLVMVVGLDSVVGKTCRIHVSMAEGFNHTPKAMLQAVFDFAFNEEGHAMLVGIVNSKNEKAMRYDLHLGFIEHTRLPEMHDNGGDIVVLTMTREQCRYLNMKEAA